VANLFNCRFHNPGWVEQAKKGGSAATEAPATVAVTRMRKEDAGKAKMDQAKGKGRAMDTD
jgi:hypothetical protein